MIALLLQFLPLFVEQDMESAYQELQADKVSPSPWGFEGVQLASLGKSDRYKYTFRNNETWYLKSRLSQKTQDTWLS